MQTDTMPPAVPAGKIKCFGEVGPKYEVGQAIGHLDDGDWMVEITMVDSGEKEEYRYSHLINDPDAL